MARTHASGCDIFISEFDFSGISNSVEIEAVNNLGDVTSFTDTGATFLEGKQGSNITINAVYDDTFDAIMFADLGSATNNLLAISSIAMADGGDIWIAEAQCLTNNPMGTIGDAAVMNATWQGTDPLGDGTIMERDSNITGTVNGTGVNLGQVLATQRIMATIHVIAAAGGTLDITIESDSSDDFTGSQNLQLTFSTVTTSVTAEIKTKDGLITDTWWRSKCIGAGGSPVYDVLVTLAITPL